MVKVFFLSFGILMKTGISFQNWICFKILDVDEHYAKITFSKASKNTPTTFHVVTYNVKFFFSLSFVLYLSETDSWWLKK